MVTTMSFFQEEKTSQKVSLPWLMSCETKVNHRISVDLGTVQQEKKTITWKGSPIEIDVWVANLEVAGVTMHSEELPREFFAALDWNLDLPMHDFGPKDTVKVLFRRYAWKEGEKWKSSYPLLVLPLSKETEEE